MESAPPEIKRVNVLFALAKHAYKMRAFKLARSPLQVMVGFQPCARSGLASSETI